MKKVSIITVNYNDAQGMRATAESVVSQTCFDDVEWIVIDGGSTDGSVDVIREYADKIAYWVSEKDKGIYHAMNKGIAQAHGEYLLFRNSGDLMSSPDTIEKFIQHPAYGKYDHCTGVTEIMRAGQWFRNIIPEQVLTLHSFIDPLVLHPSTFIKRGRLKNFPYDESLRVASDAKFFFIDMVFRNASYAPLDFAVCKFDSSGISSVNQELSMSEVRAFLQEYLPPRILSDYDQLHTHSCNADRILHSFTRTRTWEYRVLAYVAWLLYIPRYVLRRTRRVYEKTFKRPW